MKIVCITIGKKHDASLQQAIETYQTRLKAYVPFEFDYISVSDKIQESASILKRLKPDDAVLLLDETGDSINNQQLALHLEGLQNSGTKRLVIIIGGAYGVDASIFNRSNLVISLSKLVLPHQIVRLVLVEQLYRSFNLLAGGKYHHQ